MLDDDTFPVARLIYGIVLGSSETGWRFAEAGRWSTPAQLIGRSDVDMDDEGFVEYLRRALRADNAPRQVKIRPVNRPVPRYVLAAEVVSGRPGEAWEIDPHRLLALQRGEGLARTLARAATALAKAGLTPTRSPAWLLAADLPDPTGR